MEIKYFQITDPTLEPYGIWCSSDSEVTGELIGAWFKSYLDSDMWNEKGEDGFSDFVKEIGYTISRVFVEPIEIYN